MNYYFVSYSNPSGFGNAFFYSEGEFNVREVEEWLRRRTPELYRKDNGPVVLFFQEITKAQYERVNPPLKQAEDPSIAHLTFAFGLFIGLLFCFLTNQ